MKIKPVHISATALTSKSSMMAKVVGGDWWRKYPRSEVAVAEHKEVVVAYRAVAKGKSMVLTIRGPGLRSFSRSQMAPVWLVVVQWAKKRREEGRGRGGSNQHGRNIKALEMGE